MASRVSKPMGHVCVVGRLQPFSVDVFVQGQGEESGPQWIPWLQHVTIAEEYVIEPQVEGGCVAIGYLRSEFGRYPEHSV